MTNRRCRPLSSTVYRVEGKCSECGAEMMVPYNRKRLRNLCDECAEDQQRRYREERDELRQSLAAERSRWNPGEYKMVVDADESWTPETHLTEKEVVQYVANGYLAEGTVFECRGKRKMVKSHRLVAVEE